MLAAITSGTPAWLPATISCLSIVIALSALGVAIWNFRLSRFPHVRLKFSTYSRQDATGMGHYFDVEVESWGLPVWDMKVELVGDYSGDYCKELGCYRLAMVPVGTVPNPMHPGQVMKFRVERERVREIDRMMNISRGWGLSELPPDRVRVDVYGSGERLVKRMKRDRFDFGFSIFDKLRQPEA